MREEDSFELRHPVTVDQVDLGRREDTHTLCKKLRVPKAEPCLREYLPGGSRSVSLRDGMSGETHADRPNQLELPS